MPQSGSRQGLFAMTTANQDRAGVIGLADETPKHGFSTPMRLGRNPPFVDFPWSMEPHSLQRS